ncbi:SET domain-containing protein-lysine N-methyltransferase [Sphingomonas sp.]|uniref:SET domain-containing protein n=1 Tax=Sphingomonas sp. TaxID=28214 RepID=UPI00286BD500|nr:SET domain-containing protein-lysine N-methyltransferase [Sphingomonas sp.]
MGRAQILPRHAPAAPLDEPDCLTPLTTADQPREPWDRDFIRVGRSRIEGTGVFAKRRIHRGARIIEYLGERVATDRLLAPVPGAEPARIYVFRLNDNVVIDGARGGNAARFINHSCAPNCQAYAFDDRLYIYALVDIARGDELTFDYKLAAPSGLAADSDRDSHACACGAATCRGTMRQSARDD